MLQYTYFMIRIFASVERNLFLFLLIGILFFSVSTSVLAQGAAGVGIRPAVINDRMEPGELRQYSIQLNNLSEIDQTYYVSSRDILGVREGGVPIFSNGPAEKTGFELSEWITLDRTEVFIPVGGTEMVSFVLEVPKEAAPGSHFGGVIISVEPPEIKSSGASIGYEVANIISIRIAGDAKDQAKIRQFSTSKYIYSKTEVDFAIRIENEGNTLVTPVGPLEVFNMFGKRVATLDFNDSQAGIYPKTQVSNGMRDFEISWQDDGIGFGRYEAILSAVYGEEGSKNTLSSTVSFWVLPMNIIGPAALILAVLLLVIYIAIRIYVRRSIAMMSTGATRRLVRSRQRNQFPIVLLLVSMLSVTTLFLIVLLVLFA
jgi:hypothetical protein